MNYQSDTKNNHLYYRPDSGLTTKEVIQYSLLGIVLTGAAIIAGRKIVHKAEANNEQKKTANDGSPSAYAKQIKMAFDNDGWWGTNKDALRQAFRDIQSQEDFDKVIKSYKKLYNRNLPADMQSELKSTEYNEMMAIVTSKPKTFSADATTTATDTQLTEWAKRLKAAFDIAYGPFPGTDEAAIKAVILELPSQGVFVQVGAVYKRMYGNDLIADLKSELEFWEYSPMMQLIANKPNN